eukprot:CAMPEP_0114407384 /NCGR_PEP_ID=MMETSP0102-20121206/21904_1 /TAXON_ID=38822 ORGANISM="Pteridomonas danica, Strain PT" /NCGR_SAMPLE_ID=MMETSP0102 /ASSEMBLY_ACC=CAM_ASM_000212 /LENGTH=215 /DNA_ID=CAMNT_0001573829 /DNA_START=1050 /DNA_END=1694 /DNA_ORIENTATION=+
MSSSSNVAEVGISLKQLASAFRRKDRNDKGYLSSDAFRNVLSDELDLRLDRSEVREAFRNVLSDELDLRLDKSEVRDLIDLFDIHNDEKVRYEMFSRWVCAGQKLSSLERRIGTCLDLLQEENDQDLDLAEMFEKAEDKDSDGDVTQSDFVRIVSSLGLAISSAEIRAVARAYSDRNRRVEWKKFTLLGGGGVSDKSNGGRDLNIKDFDNAVDLA